MAKISFQTLDTKLDILSSISFLDVKIEPKK